MRSAEKYGANEGRDPFPKLVKKSKVPKTFFGLQGLGVAVDDLSDKTYIQDRDLRVGKTIQVYGRNILLYGCDEFTRHYYQQVPDFTKTRCVQCLTVDNTLLS